MSLSYLPWKASFHADSAIQVDLSSSANIHIVDHLLFVIYPHQFTHLRVDIVECITHAGV